MSMLHFSFIVVAFFAIYIQAKSYALAGVIDGEETVSEDLKNLYKRLLKIRRFNSPFIAGLAAVFVAVGTYSNPKTSLFVGVLFSAVWGFASIGDIFIEGSYSISDPATKEKFYFVGMLIFIVVTLGCGGGLIYYAFASTNIGFWWIAGAVAVSIIMGILAFFSLEVTKENLVICLVYDVSVCILLCGGLLSAIAGNMHMAFIGITYFISDWCVGLRDFGKYLPDFFKEHMLIVIVTIYYLNMLISIDLVL